MEGRIRMKVLQVAQAVARGWEGKGLAYMALHTEIRTLSQNNRETPWDHAWRERDRHRGIALEGSSRLGAAEPGMQAAREVPQGVGGCPSQRQPWSGREW